ncbi:MAG: CBS domain-containing protein [Candidatus Omnitrophota bacterium]|jgi:CBS domain-containing protein|nr:MAG: CBS domain-containing protein [Candidatus Omnitrophota bacterium]
MNPIKVGDVMIPLAHYPHIPYWFTLRQAMVEMEKSEIEMDGRKSLPRIILVFDEAYQLLGMIRRRDILRGLEPNFSDGQSLYKQDIASEEHASCSEDLSFDRIVNLLKEHAERPVREVMLPIEVTVEFEDFITNAIYKMVENNLSLIPVLKDGQVVGVIRSVDVFQRLAKLIM